MGWTPMIMIFLCLSGSRPPAGSSCPRGPPATAGQTPFSADLAPAQSLKGFCPALRLGTGDAPNPNRRARALLNHARGSRLAAGRGHPKGSLARFFGSAPPLPLPTHRSGQAGCDGPPACQRSGCRLRPMYSPLNAALSWVPIGAANMYHVISHLLSQEVAASM